MDVHCTTCGEPWDVYHLMHDAICDTGLSSDEIDAWRRLPSTQRLSHPVREQFLDAGWHFGRSLMNVTKCPACPAGAYPDQEKVTLKAEIESMLVGDDDGLAAQYEDLGL